VKKKKKTGLRPHGAGSSVRADGDAVHGAAESQVPGRREKLVRKAGADHGAPHRLKVSQGVRRLVFIGWSASWMTRYGIPLSSLTGAPFPANQDHPFDNTSWARFCDIPLLTLNGMERQFLEALQFELFLAPSHMEGLLDSLETEQACLSD
jgi:hypothetical protein